MSANVRLTRWRIKRKAASRCAETVDGGDSLWKATEKSGEIL
jgi:hypothetical protein